jgi:ATP-dependent exoDNAse (exonuclease V) alpha subunit
MIHESCEQEGKFLDQSVAQDQAREGLGWGMEHLSERQSVFERTDLLRFSLEASVGSAGVKDVRDAIQEAEQADSLIAVGQHRMTTFGALQREAETVWTMERGQGVVEPILSPGRTREALQESNLTAGQADAAEFILTTTNRFVGVEGKAGTGKTTMVRTVQELASDEGYRLQGLAPSAAAARQLEEQGGIPSQTVSSFLAERATESRDVQGRPSKTLYLVDESSMLSTRQVADLTRRTEQEDSRMVFLGDRQQLAAIEAGKPFAVLIDRGMAHTEMSEILRQEDESLKSVVEQTIDGRMLEAVAQLDEEGRISEIADRETRLNAVDKAYFEQSQDRQREVLVLTGSRADQQYLNGAIREQLVEQGTVNGPAVSADILMSQNMTKAQARNAESYSSGDVIRFGKTYTQLGVEKGEYARVESINREKHHVALLMERDGRSVTWQPEKTVVTEASQVTQREVQAGDQIRWTRNDPERDRRNGETARVVAINKDGRSAIVETRGSQQHLEFQSERHFEYGYSSTVHSSQGRTTDATVYHIDSTQGRITGKESWYVGISRARQEVQIYTDDRAALPGAVAQSHQQESSIEAVEQSRSDANQSVAESRHDRVQEGHHPESAAGSRDHALEHG